MKITSHTVFKRDTIAHLLYAILFLLASALIFWKCRYGLANIDESFYLTIPYRLYQGDALFAHEWHLSQMSGIFMLPFVAIYHAIVGSLDGIFLASRYLFTVCMLIAALFVFHRLKRYNLFGAAIASICLLLFAPYGMMALSYNSIGILTLIAACVLLLTGTKRIEYVISGAVFAFAVLCNPYLIIVYGLLVLLFLVLFLPIRLLQTEHVLALRKMLWQILLPFTLGAMFVAVLFFAFVLSRASLSEVFATLPHMMDDPEHPEISISNKIVTFLYHIIVVNRYTKFGYFGLALLAMLCIVDKKRKTNSHKCFYFVSVSICVTFLLYVIYIRNHTLNYLMWPLCCFAPFVLLLSDNPQNRRLFLGLWIPGMLYAFCMHLSSNQNFYAISSASIVALMGTLPMIASLASEISSACIQRTAKLGLSLVLSVMLLSLLVTEARERYVNIFWDTSIETQTEPIEDGIDKGIYVSEGMYESYYHDLEVVAQLEATVPTTDRVLFIDYNPHLYLMTDLRMGSYSAWLSIISEFTIAHLTEFYALQPALLPDTVYVDPEYADCASLFQETFGYREIPFDLGILLIRQ